jgi:hypothetical protein
MPLIGDMTAIPGQRAMIQELLKVPSVAAARVCPKLNKRVDRMFDSGTDPYGNPWAPLKPSTIRRKRAYRWPSKILVRAKKLWPATRFVPRGGSGLSMVVGDSGIHAQSGAPAREPRAIVPQYGLPSEWRKDIKSAVDAELRARAKRR